jgi:hypothetical protein
VGPEAVANAATTKIHVAGAVCLSAGLFGAAATICLALVSPVESGGFTFPHGAAEFTGLQMVIAATRAGLVFGLLGLSWSGALPLTRSARFARDGAVIMMALLTVVEGLAVTVARGPLDGTPPGYGVIYAAYTVLLGVALLVMGLGVARAGAWHGWRRWLPLCLGAWVLVVVLPALALSFDAARWATSGSLVLFAVLGLVLIGQDGPPSARPAAAHRPGTRSARSAAVVTWAYVAAFGAPAIPNAAYVVQNGSLPSFLGIFEMYGGPWSTPFEEGPFLLLLTGFLIVTLAAAWAAWLVWQGSRAGGVLSLALLPVEAVFWLGFGLPLPWLLGLIRAGLVIAGWKSLTWWQPATR